VDIASPNNSQTNQGICLGWDVPLTAQPTAVVVKLVNAFEDYTPVKGSLRLSANFERT